MTPAASDKLSGMHASRFHFLPSRLTRPLPCDARPVCCWLGWLAAVLVFLGNGTVTAADEPVATPEQLEFFETKIRPLLVEHCFECHSAEAPKGIKGGLQLDSRAGLLKGGDNGPGIDPAKPDDSLLLQAVRWQGFEMPPKGKLPPAELQALADWVKQGAPWPAASPANSTGKPRVIDWTTVRDEHWAWRPIRRPDVPAVPPAASPNPERADWVRNPIDAFVLEKLLSAGLAPSPPAEEPVLLRRVYLDLIGLPPTPAEVDAFVEASARDPEAALSEVVDRLLARPAYGERWGRHWLDLARYSDIAGNFGGPPIPHAWRYRDWVVTAFNADLPYDQFVRAQIAGDLLGHESAAATGFFALGPTYVSDGGDPDATAQAQSETLDDRVDTLSRALLGLTVSCARCHDHKFDPIPQLDYYSLAGVFQNTRLAEHPLVPAETVALFQAHQQQIGQLDQKLKALDETLKKEARDPTPDEAADRELWATLLAQLQKTIPPMYPIAHGLAESGSADMAVAIRGNLRKPGPVAPRRFLRILTGAEPALFQQGSGRLDLASALTAESNPLLARVFVNRVWMHHLGRALVRTPSNFGIMGEAPTHPELLDWLASEFQQPTGGGVPWSIKRLHRLIVLSNTWRQSSRSNERGMSLDADNRLLWRANPRRMDVEVWRDTLLAVTGELDSSVGGPSVENLLASPRRTLYGTINRNSDQGISQVFLRLFDFPAARASSEGRAFTTIPQQSLFLMNSPFMAERARQLARRLQAEFPTDAERVPALYARLYSRMPTAEELQIGLAYLAAPSEPMPGDQLSRWEQYAQVLLSANELMFVE